MSRRGYTEEFRIEAVKKVTKNGYSITDTAERLGVHPDSLRTGITTKKIPVSLRLDNDIVLFFKKLASEKKVPYQTLINALLRKELQAV